MITLANQMHRNSAPAGGLLAGFGGKLYELS